MKDILQSPVQPYGKKIKVQGRGETFITERKVLLEKHWIRSNNTNIIC